MFLERYILMLTLEGCEIPFPDLRWQILGIITIHGALLVPAYRCTVAQSQYSGIRVNCNSERIGRRCIYQGWLPSIVSFFKLK
jgi:hypothetical protein